MTIARPKKKPGMPGFPADGTIALTWRARKFFTAGNFFCEAISLARRT
jgi:hypothetical protein